MVILILIVVLFVSFVLAWRALGDLEAPKDIYKSFRRPFGKVKKWGTLIFTKGRQIYYSEDKINTHKKENNLNGNV